MGFNVPIYRSLLEESTPSSIKGEKMSFLDIAYSTNRGLSAKNATPSTKVKLTLASAKDKFPTVTASRLGIKAKKKTDLLLVTLASASGTTYSVTFRRNRFVSANNATFIATNWPKSLRKPKVGSPINLTLVAIAE